MRIEVRFWDDQRRKRTVIETSDGAVIPTDGVDHVVRVLRREHLRPPGFDEDHDLFAVLVDLDGRDTEIGGLS